MGAGAGSEGGVSAIARSEIWISHCVSLEDLVGLQLRAIVRGAAIDVLDKQDLMSPKKLELREGQERQREIDQSTFGKTFRGSPSNATFNF